MLHYKTSWINVLSKKIFEQTRKSHYNSSLIKFSLFIVVQIKYVTRIHDNLSYV